MFLLNPEGISSREKVTNPLVRTTIGCDLKQHSLCRSLAAQICIGKEVRNGRLKERPTHIVWGIENNNPDVRAGELARDLDPVRALPVARIPVSG